MKATWNGVVVAESDDIVTLEGNNYFPRAALKDEYTTFSNHRSSCVWKGQAQWLSLFVNGEMKPDAVWFYPAPVSHNRYLRLCAWAGPLKVSYHAVVDLHHHLCAPELIAETPVSRLPTEVLSYIYPSRYCQSDLLGPLVMAEFGNLPQGYSRVVAIQDWVRRRVKFEGNTTTSATSAIDTLNEGRGVCRDFAHLMIALCRALNIPARFATGIDFGA